MSYNEREGVIMGGQGISLGSLFNLGDDAAGVGQPGVLTSNRYVNLNGHGVSFVGETDSVPIFFRIEDDGTLLFDKTGATGGFIFKVQPLQVGQGNSTFSLAHATGANPDGARNNEVYTFGINAGINGPDEASKTGLYWSYEGHYQPTPGNDYHELHLVLRDKIGISHRIETWFLDKDVPDNWVKGYLASDISIHDPNSISNDGTYFQINRASSETSRMRLLGSLYSTGGGSKGAEFFINTSVGNEQLAISRFGTMPSTAPLFLNDWERVWAKLLNLSVTTGSDAPTAILGIAGNNDVQEVGLDSSLAIINGVLGSSGKQAVVTSSAGTLTLAASGFYSFTGTNTTWSLPTIAAGTTGNTYDIKNRGSGNITLDVIGGGSTIYDTSAVASITILPGEAIRIGTDATYHNKL